MSPAAILALILQYRYPILVPVALVAGFPTGMVVGVAIRLGYLELFLAYACIMLGELIGDVIWYVVGYYRGETFARRFGKYIGITDANITKAKELFRKYDQRILFSSKLTTGFGFAIPILFTAGMSRMSFWRYMRANISGQFIWSGALIAVGYFFGDLYLRVDTVFERVSTISAFVIVLACFFGFAKYAWSRINQRAAS
ncbi:MAG TPA: DedA family protein [Candidatus Paceibacterota bacterium]|jgi:membrane protein DedA with SNARE-associated domain|nr:DedA family protein [Candidatus Paceibacterota bacterium]